VSRRLERVSEQLRVEIARVVRKELTDPRVAWVTITRVDVSPDLRNALVFWSRMDAPDAPDPDTAAEGLASAAPAIRHKLAAELPLRRMPALTFRYDPSLTLGDHALALLRRLNDESSG